MNAIFNEKLDNLKLKYATRIAGIAVANEVDLGVATDMLISNAERGTAYAGGGECTVEEWAEIVADVKDLRA